MLIGASWEEVRMPLAALLVPIAAYWTLATFFEVLQMLNIPWVDRCRLHTKEEEEKVNLVTKRQCIRMVAVQHIIQTGIGLLFLDPEVSRPLPPFWVRSLQVVLGMLVIDTWQYWMHRLFHENKFLYKHIHSHHHRLYAPYAFGALYNHPLEGLLFDTVSGALAYEISLMDNQTALYFFTFATLKTVMDHCSYVWPANPTFYMLPNNSLFHDVHHQPYGIKFNYSQPFFTHWDHWFGTYMPPPEHLYPQAVKGKVE